MNEIGTQGRRDKKIGTLLVALIIIALGGSVWFLLPLGSRSRPSAPVPTANRPVTSPAAKEELEKFQGTWDFISLEVDGDVKPDSDFKKYTVVFQGNQWTVSEGTNIAAQTTIELNPAANPKTIDVFSAPGKGQPIHGIYVFEDDKLTICDRGEDKGERPTDFSTEPNSGLVLIVFKRPKDFPAPARANQP